MQLKLIFGVFSSDGCGQSEKWLRRIGIANWEVDAFAEESD